MAKGTAKFKAPPGLLEALEEFPRFLKEKKRRRDLRKKFVEAKFGDVSRQLLRAEKAREKKSEWVRLNLRYTPGDFVRQGSTGYVDISERGIRLEVIAEEIPPRKISSTPMKWRKWH